MTHSLKLLSCLDLLSGVFNIGVFVIFGIQVLTMFEDDDSIFAVIRAGTRLCAQMIDTIFLS
jgi:hypothetical protein